MNSQTYVTFGLDSSGSPSKIDDDTQGGFNTFLMEKREESEVAVTLHDFDSTVELVYRGPDIVAAETLDTDNYRTGD